MRVGFLCAHNPYDRNSFSGTAYYAFRGLQEMAYQGGISELRVLGTHRPPNRFNRYGNALRARLGLGRRKLTFRREADLGNGLDWIISLVSTDIAVSLAPRLRAPLAHVTDATPQFLRDFYGHDISAQKEAAEAWLVAHARRVIYSSHFMMERACNEFGEQYRSRMRAIPFGVNLDSLPVESCIPEHMPEPCQPIELLFIGKEWERKGGPLALGIVAAMRRNGRAARLTIIGCDPEAAAGVEGVTVLPYLDKNNPEHSRIFDELLDKAHLFLLPTRADCTPMVIAEANAHSLPVLVTDVGGISSLVSQGRNGRMLPLEASAGEWAAEIEDILADPTLYRALRATSFSHYRERLNWGAWTRELIADLASS